MLLYVESKAFPYRSFVVRVQSSETIARVRAQLLHILYEIGRDDHQFRLRFKGEYLRDAYTVEEYGLVENAVIKMIPLERSVDDVSDIESMSMGSHSDIRTSFLLDIKNALKKEVRIFDKREELIFHFKGLLFLHFMAAVLCFMTTYWYAGCWSLVLWFLADYFCPSFTRLGGFIGQQSLYKERFCILYGMAALICVGAAIYFCVVQWTLIIGHGCKDWEFVDECSHKEVFSAIFYGFHALLLLVSACIIFVLLGNMAIKYGDYVEKYLVQSRDIEYVMKAARSGRTKEKRVAAFELATMAALGDENKFRIVAEGGLEVLIQMALSKDETTQEHAVEAIAELLTVPTIQENFVEMGGIRTLTALLHSTDPRLVYQVTSALSYIVAESEENKMIVVADQGLSDLAHAARSERTANQRVLAGIFLELAFNPDIRAQMASLNTPAQALITLCRSPDSETQRFALQTLELLAIESPEMICAQEELLELLVKLPFQIYDHKVLTLAGKILLYFAENIEKCDELLDQTRCKESLLKYARTKDPILQKVAIKVIYCMLEVNQLRTRALHLGLPEVLKYVRDHAADRTCWDMADQALQYSEGEEPVDNSFAQLPALTTLEKVDKMDPQKKADALRMEFGSRTSIGSRASVHSRFGDPADEYKKGIN